MTEDYGTASWRYWQEIRNAQHARASFQTAFVGGDEPRR